VWKGTTPAHVGSQPANYQFDNTDTGPHTVAGIITSYSGGLSSGDPLDGTPTCASANVTTTHTATGLTTSFNNSMLHLFSPTEQSTTSASWSSPLTEEEDSSIINTADGVQASAGASGNKSQTSSTSADSVSILMAFREESEGTAAFPAGILNNPLTY
jgi:hypothetical protein